MVKTMNPCWLAAIAVALFVVPERAFAQTDEIQVYDASHADPGVFSLTWHNNFTPKGVSTPAFPGANVPDKSLNGVTEWAYGVNDWFEAGLYLPLYSIDKNRGATLDGFKLRALFTVSHADDRRFVYGVNFEFSVNAKHWDATRFTSEIRPIVGWHLKPVDIVINPILDTSYDGFKKLVFAPATRVAYNFSPTLAVAVEEYADFGPLRGFYPRSEQSHQLYGVVDHRTRLMDIEAAVGFGLTRASDKFTLKLILARDLKTRRI